MAEYDWEDAEKVAHHLYDTLEACLDFFTNLQIANPALEKEYNFNLIGELMTDLEEHWGASEAEEEEAAEQKEEEKRRTEGLVTLAKGGVDIQNIIMQDVEEEVEEVKMMR